MPTPNERKALVFFSFIALLGTVARVVHALRDPPSLATAESRAALARQIDAVDSVRHRAQRPSGGRARRARTSGDETPDSAPATSAGGGAGAMRAYARVPHAAVASAPLYLAPAPDASSDGSSVGVRGARPAGPIDVDVAGVAELEGLPRVGPALARRIVASRDSLGPFGGMEGLRRVRGIGPAVAAGLAPYVTFSGRVRPSDASETGVHHTARGRSLGRRGRP